METEEIEFVDVMEARRTKGDAFGFMRRQWRPQAAHRLQQPLTPHQLREEVANSLYIKSICDAKRQEGGGSSEDMRRQVRRLLEEMGLERRMLVVRGLGMAFIKTVLAMKMSVFVNERRILQLKEELGANPVLFLPTHRSYADFCLMTYLCYHYDIELPAVAAGMDFYHMAGMGRVMRDTGAFYIPRSLAGDELRAHVLRRYVRALVTHHAAPLEFFIEGARSRANKPLAPKYGLLAMALLPLFTREVADVTVVPVHIAYERIVEQTLFAYEHLGVPKPKESTRGLLRTLSFLNDDFGRVYVHVGRPLSARQYLGDELRPDAAQLLRPLELQELSAQQFGSVRALADDVLVVQQKYTVLTTYNLLATLLMQAAARDAALPLAAATEGVAWLARLARAAGAAVPGAADDAAVRRALAVHRAAVRLERGDALRLVAAPAAPPPHHTRDHVRGHLLEPETMRAALPIVQLQLYVNPVACCFAPAAFVALSLAHKRPPLPHEELLITYCKLRALHKYEFFYVASKLEQSMESALAFCLENGAVLATDTGYSLGDNTRLLRLLHTLAWPSLHTLLALLQLLREEGHSCEQHRLWRLAQQRAEQTPGSHPYCLSLEAVRNCIAGLVYAGVCVLRGSETEPRQTLYTTSEEKLREAERLLRRAAPDVGGGFVRAAAAAAPQAPAARL